jgi:hypothetical protein
MVLGMDKMYWQALNRKSHSGPQRTASTRQLGWVPSLRKWIVSFLKASNEPS